MILGSMEMLSKEMVAWNVPLDKIKEFIVNIASAIQLDEATRDDKIVCSSPTHHHIKSSTRTHCDVIRVATGHHRQACQR